MIKIENKAIYTVKICLYMALIVIITCSCVYSQQVGFVYPAGGQQGTTIRVFVGGRQLVKAQSVSFSGSGVTGNIVQSYSKLVMNTEEERKPSLRLYEEEKSILDAPPENRSSLRQQISQLRQQRQEDPGMTADEKAYLTDEEICGRFPLFRQMVDSPSDKTVQMVYYEYFSNRPDRRPMESINQGLLVEINIDSNASVGSRQMYIRIPGKTLSPVTFEISPYKEIMELEPDDSSVNPFIWKDKQKYYWAAAELPVAELPAVFNGQIYAGDTDYFKFQAKKGQTIVLYVRGRYLSPYLADAVPGWFQPLITLYDSQGKSLGYSQSYKFEPDPCLITRIPEDGMYTVEIRDSLYRGRADFVYRIYAGAIPFVRSIYPMGGQQGTSFQAAVFGVNLPVDTIRIDKLDLSAGSENTDGVITGTIDNLNKIPLVRPVKYTIESFPTVQADREAQKSSGQSIPIPAVVFGKLPPGQAHCFTFEGKKDQKISCDITAQSLESTLDAELELLDSSGKIMAQNDDRADSKGPNFGLQTHHSDPMFSVQLPSDGKYTVRVYGAYQTENPEDIYRLSVSEVQPRFLLYCQSTAISFGNATTMLKIGVVRQNGFDGAIEILPADNQPGLSIQGGVIPPGENQVLMTISADEKFWPTGEKNEEGKNVFPSKEIQLVGKSTWNNTDIVRPVIAVEDKEQAFIYHHFMPADGLTAEFKNGRQPGFEVLSPLPLEFNEGKARLELGVEKYADNPKSKSKSSPRRKAMSKTDVFQISPECSGFEMEDVNFDGMILTATIKITDRQKVPTTGNLIIEFRHLWQIQDSNGKPRSKQPPFGYLPALNYVIK